MLLVTGDLYADSGTALHFNGSNSVVSVTSNTSSNAFPLTVSAWFRSQVNSGGQQVLASKYVNSSGNGWALLVQTGQLRGFYYSNVGTNKAIDVTTGPNVADGLWHHAALIVDVNGGSLYLDGTLLATNGWAGSHVPATTTIPLTLGNLADQTLGLNGDLDEVTMWNRALTGNELNYLKHRQLHGNEDGLIAYWKLDDGANTTTLDASGHGYLGTLVNAPAWVPSGAPVPLNVVSTNCLKFAGTGDYVSVPHSADLNSFPFTTTAWIKTSRNAAQVDGIVSKYFDSKFNGYALFLVSGHVHAWYFKDSLANSVYGSGYGLDGGFVADNDWHHIAFTVDTGGGNLIVDGKLVQHLAWSGSSGAPTTNANFQIGKYDAIANSFLGQIDEVTLWNRAFSTNEIQAMKNLPLVGNETGLRGYWKMDEGTSTTANDTTTYAHNGTLISNPAWVGSTAFIGDGAAHLATSADYANLTRNYGISTSAAQPGFLYNVSATLTRFYDYGSLPAVETVSGLLDYSLQISPGAMNIPLKTSEVSFGSSLGSYLASSPVPIGAANGKLTYSTTIGVEPNGVQLDSVNNLHQLTATLSHSENGGAYNTDQATTSAVVRLLHFDGNLFAGNFRAMFSLLSSQPIVSNIVAGDHLDCSLPVSTGGGYVPGFPSYTFGNGSALAVSLGTTGDATLKNGFIFTSTPVNDFDSIQNISFQRSRITLSTNGAATIIYLNLPTGLSVGLGDTNDHRTTNTIPFVTLLDASLHPATNTLSYPGPLYFSSETLACWITGASINWDVNGGVLTIPSTAVSFLRQAEDDGLTAIQGSLTDPNTSHRISNDSYLRNAQYNGASPNFTVTADSNGVAQVNGSMVLQPPEVRPHFPYTDILPGSQIPTGQGMLVLSNSLVDASSYLNVSPSVPLAYARDCADTNCSGASIGPASIRLTPTSGQLSFTPDGGLLAYGTVADGVGGKDPNAGVQLAWGYSSGKNFAQQTSALNNGVYAMAGTFLLGNQSSLDISERPAVLLFTGWGDDSNPIYFERPGTASYDLNGYANYAGINLRAPAQGQSFIANVPTGLYPLTARSKYYVRYGGVSGIHEAASFPTNFSLYGYPFSFASYRLSYLDSENKESRTDGQITFPAQPAGFFLEFSRMKFVCSGGLDNAQLPPFVAPKHLAYWNVDFKPQSIEFKPRQDEQCATADRFLTVGAEVTMPFITQPLHGALGFWPSGNLVTAADKVVDGVDSRFTVPGNLTLKGAGGTNFPITTASQGYFNNWSNSQRPAAGFFNLAGKIRVPFFTDMKVHLHITPVSSDNSRVDVMGGWPLTGSGAGQGWNVGTNNYFNTGKFDPSAFGWPQNLSSVDLYRTSGTEQYHPRAQRNWHDLVFFDYPVTYNSVLHKFEGFVKSPVTLPITDVDSNLKSLTPTKVDLDFSDNINFKLPKVKGLDFLSDTAGEINAPFNSISNAIFGELKDISDKSGLSRGFDSLDKVLREDATGFFGPILDVNLELTASNIVATLGKQQSTNPATVLSQVYSTVGSAGAGLEDVLGKINGTVNDVNSVFGKVNGTFNDVSDTMGLLERVLEKDSVGNRHVIREIVKKLIQDQSKENGLPGALADSIDTSVLSDALNQIDPTLEEILSELTELKGEVDDAHGEFTNATGGISQVLSQITNNTAEIQGFLDKSKLLVSNLLAVAETPAGDYLSADPVAARLAVKQKLEDAFRGSALQGDYQKKFKQFFSDDSFILDELLAVLTDKINSVVRAYIENYISGGGTGQVYQAMKGIGQMQQSMFTAKVTGQPLFNKDSLRSIHLDATIKLNLPNEMSFPVYLEVRELNSQTVGLACIPAGDPAQEIILGAKHVPLRWPGAQSANNLNLTANARWTVQKGAVIGVGGLLEVDGNSSFEGCTLKTIGATFAIGDTENYFAAKAEASALIGPIPVDFKAGIFGGHACSLEPLIYIDPNCTNVLNNANGFTGIYLQYGGGVSLSQILFGTSSCALDVEAIVSNAQFIEGDNNHLSIGIMQKTDLDISLLCLISGQASFTQAGIATVSPSGVQLSLLGSAELCGSAGPCPVCVKGCKTLTVKAVLKQDGFDYSLDY